MDKQRLTYLLERYSNGQCSAEEEQELHLWFDKTSQNKTWDWTNEQKASINQRLKSKIDKSIDVNSTKRLHSFPYLKIAASIILVLGFAFFWYKTNRTETIKYAVSTASIGKRVNLKLSDGTSIILNAGSKLRYPAKFGKNERLVELLEGEAFFDVAHDDKKPFIVIANKTRTQVLGTAFNIRSYHSFKEVQITVARGKVGVMQVNKKLRPTGKAAILLPNQQLQVNTSNGTMRRIQVKANEITGWISGKLVFSNESLANVSTILGNTYGMKIGFADSNLANNIKFSAYYDSTDTFKEIVFSIAKANNLKYIQQGNTIIFKQKSANQ